MKKLLSLFIAAIIMIGCLSACSSNTASESKNSNSIQIVTTIFPEYDWVMNILGENPANAEVTMLLDNGVDLHSYQPTVDDILKISTCDLFIYVGGESDEWVEDALSDAENENMIVLNLLEILGDSVKEEEVVEGMQEEEGHDHDREDSDHEEEHDHDYEDTGHEEEQDHRHEEGEVEYDEHVWLSLRNASVLCDRIASAIESLDPDHKAVYSNNVTAYKEQLHTLDREYKTAVSGSEIKTLLFGDRFPFRYLVDDYGLNYYAAFAGCSAETEASFETIVFLAEKVDELGMHAVMTIEGKDHSIAETIIQNTKTKDQTVLTMNSMQGTTANDVQDGAAYLSIMEENLSVLTEALR